MIYTVTKVHIMYLIIDYRGNCATPYYPEDSSNEHLCFWQSDETLSFHDAYEYCLETGGFLANIRGRSEIEFIESE